MGDLITRLQARILTAPTVDMAVCPPIRPRPPVDARALAGAEDRLGFRLPPLVYALYSQVGNGGYGPGYGFIELDHLVARQVSDTDGGDDDPLDLPDQYVDLVAWGCLYFSGIDCADPCSPVYFFNCDRAGEGAKRPDYLIPEAESLDEWLSAWLNGVRLWERGTQRGIHR